MSPLPPARSSAQPEKEPPVHTHTKSMCVISPDNRLVATNSAYCYAHNIGTRKDEIWSKVLSLELVFEMRKHYSFGTGQQCQSNTGTCLPGIHAS